MSIILHLQVLLLLFLHSPNFFTMVQVVVHAVPISPSLCASAVAAGSPSRYLVSVAAGPSRSLDISEAAAESGNLDTHFQWLKSKISPQIYGTTSSRLVQNPIKITSHWSIGSFQGYALEFPAGSEGFMACQQFLAAMAQQEASGASEEAGNVLILEAEEDEGFRLGAMMGPGGRGKVREMEPEEDVDHREGSTRGRRDAVPLVGRSGAGKGDSKSRESVIEVRDGRQGRGKGREIDSDAEVKVAGVVERESPWVRKKLLKA
jgi:hypothetical protein